MMDRKIQFGVLCLVFVLSSGKHTKSEFRQTPDTKDWYEKAVFYQIYPRSFMDSDNNGVGDLNGITSKLDHLANLGITGTWLSPIFTSPMKDFGYDIANFTEVDPAFGTMENLKALFAKAKTLGIKVILDFVPNHSSNLCKWFEWSENRENGYDDWYVWEDPKEFIEGIPVPPTNWVSVFYGSAWTYSEKRQQFYLHQFDYQQPDLNYRNPAVVEAMKDVLRFWLEMGADGFRVDAINHLFEDYPYEDEPVNWWGITDPNQYEYLEHIRTRDRDETYDMVYQWRELLDEWDATHGGDTKIMMTEGWVGGELFTRYYQDGTRQGSHMPFNFVFIDLPGDSKPSDFKRSIDERLSIIPEGKSVNWVLGNHDQSRIGTKYGGDMRQGMLALEMGLPGIAVTYYGEEIGMVDNRDITWEQTQDPQACNPQDPSRYQELSRDPVRTPMQWDGTANGGFTSGTPWLPVHSNYVTLNLANQVNNEKSTYNFYRGLINLREKDSLINGGYESRVLAEDNIFSYRRTSAKEDEMAYIFVINFSNNEYTVNLTQSFDNIMTSKIVLASSTSSHEVETIIDPEALVIGPYDAIILESSSNRLFISMSLIICLAIKLLYL